MVWVKERQKPLPLMLPQRHIVNGLARLFLVVIWEQLIAKQLFFKISAVNCTLIQRRPVGSMKVMNSVENPLMPFTCGRVNLICHRFYDVEKEKRKSIQKYILLLHIVFANCLFFVL